jgi:hypothetical protein
MVEDYKHVYTCTSITKHFNENDVKPLIKGTPAAVKVLGQTGIVTVRQEPSVIGQNKKTN